MNKVLYYKELKRNRKNTLIWTSIVVAFTFLILSIYPSFSQMGDQMTELMSTLPQEYARALGMDEGTWSSIIGFYSTYYGIYITLLIGIFAASTGATIIGKEERDGTAEFLLTRPVTRSNIVTTKLMALGTLLAVVYSTQTIFAVLGMNLFGDDVLWGHFVTMHVHGFVLISFFTAAAVLFSSYLSPKLNYMGPVVGMIFGSFFLDAIAKATDAVSWLGFASPYYYLQLQAESGTLEVNWGSCIVLIIIALLMLRAGHARYLKRDIVG
ncbi:MAG: hypothetical protein CMP53_06830 [Flavobacteriales bacterium]|nr:hypothetical protein [Flavobacteriales bacterium]|tara:strand:+ start:309 stop:1112 length:804 start_codon:yes stop_codon:yes gene_type:complete